MRITTTEAHTIVKRRLDLTWAQYLAERGANAHSIDEIPPGLSEITLGERDYLLRVRSFPTMADFCSETCCMPGMIKWHEQDLLTIHSVREYFDCMMEDLNERGDLEVTIRG